MGCSTADVASAVRAMAAVVVAHRDELVDLDRVIGDGDHGENLKRGFDFVVSALDTSEVDSPAAVLKLVAKTLISKVGGASGPLLGTAFLRAASGLEEVDGASVAAALRAALDGVSRGARPKWATSRAASFSQPAAGISIFA
ncbi:dihydroxyacetone kinase [Kutzneria sp. 744]|nr:dihydroxyacetone kinase [Kutzneria sp. 744]